MLLKSLSTIDFRLFQEFLTATTGNKFERNISGKFYVDDLFIESDLYSEICRETIRDAQKTALCEEAMTRCLVGITGDDGK
jgi:hypothetical protein